MKAAEWDQFMKSVDDFEERKKLLTPVMNNMRYQIDRMYSAGSFPIEFRLSPVAYKRLCWEINNQRSPLSYTETPQDIATFEGISIKISDEEASDILLVAKGYFRGKLPDVHKEGFEKVEEADADGA